MLKLAVSAGEFSTPRRRAVRRWRTTATLQALSEVRYAKIDFHFLLRHFARLKHEGEALEFPGGPPQAEHVWRQGALSAGSEGQAADAGRGASEGRGRHTSRLQGLHPSEERRNELDTRHRPPEVHRHHELLQGRWRS